MMVTQEDLNNVGSETIGRTLLEAARQRERMDDVDVTSGNRPTAYVIEGEAGTGLMDVNCSAYGVQPGDVAIILAHAHLGAAEARPFVPRVVFVDHDNRIVGTGGEPGLVPNGFELKASRTTQGQS